MKRVQVKWKQVLTHGPAMFGLDVTGQLWERDATAPQGWRKVAAPIIELEDRPPVSQIPAKEPIVPFPRTVHFDKGSGPTWRR